MALSDATRHIIWLNIALKEIGVNYKSIMHADSNRAIDLAKNHRIYQRSKHIDIRYHFIRSHVDVTFQLEYISTNNNLADIMTKQLTKSSHQRLAAVVRCSPEGKCCK